ncbi:MAG TPA: deoxyhypusine synthase family protein [Candidatus Lokiarchaeia archaeon]|nr:deoxyhypusine synthase family protein [Candidatus Lokiarchaeia archaeon]
MVEKKLDALQPIDLRNANSVSDIIRQMQNTSFGARRVGDALDVLVKMYQDEDCLKILTLSGAMTPAQMSWIICDLIESKTIDVIVSTGALISHGLIENMGLKHYKCPDNVKDIDLYNNNTPRIYDTLELDYNLNEMEKIVYDVLDAHVEGGEFQQKQVFCSKFICEWLGEYIHDHFMDARGILKSAFDHHVPVFIPAFTDSEMGLDFAMWSWDDNARPPFDAFADLKLFTEIVQNAPRLGVFTIGGGVPRNWTQQVAPFIETIGERDLTYDDDIEDAMQKWREENPDKVKQFDYGVRICPEPTHLGGLSGCTYSEGISWGKFNPNGYFAEIYCDATIILPFLVKALFEQIGYPAGSNPEAVNHNYPASIARTPGENYKHHLQPSPPG